MKYLTFILFLMLISCTSSDYRFDSLEFYSEKNRIQWNDYELKVSKKERENIVEQLKKEFVYYFHPQYVAQQRPFSETIHILDLNGDKQPDVIFEGWSGAKSNYVQFFIAENKTFRKVIEKYQYIKKLNIKDGVLKSFTTLDFGCCSDYVDFETHYLVSRDFKTTIFYQRAKVKTTTAPEKMFSQPIKLKLNTDAYLRLSPAIQDDSIQTLSKGIGNHIGLYPSESMAYAWSEQGDWWFVEMLPNLKVKSSIIYKSDENIFANQLGWIEKKKMELVFFVNYN